jgi:hypothetical protein
MEAAGVGVVRVQDVLVADIEDRPGALAELYEKGGFPSVAFAYMTTGGQIVIGMDHPDQLADARKRLGLA